jgi:hypothetical protein
MFTHEVVPLPLAHLFELEVSSVGRGTEFASLQDDKQHSANDWDEVKWQVDEVSDDRFRGKACEWLFHDLAQFRDWVTAGLDLALRGNQ